MSRSAAFPKMRFILTLLFTVAEDPSGSGVPRSLLAKDPIRGEDDDNDDDEEEEEEATEVRLKLRERGGRGASVPNSRKN